MASESFGVVDYVLLIATLMLSMGVGIYFAIAGRRKDTSKSFFLGGKQLPILPTALSLLATFISGISILAYPAEMYTMGTAFVWTIVGACLAIILTAVFVIPVFYGIDSVNLYQYLEDRFNSKFLRCFGSIMFTLNTLIYVGVALYAPSTALSGATGIDTWVFILVVGLVGCLYTTIGGIKAVIWTDTLQAVIMYTGLLAMVIRGLMRVGGFNQVMEISGIHGRLDGFLNFDPNPFQYNTAWTATFGGFFYWASAFCSSQMALQRYCSLPSLRKARLVAVLNIPCVIIVFLLVFVNGLIMYTYYAGCDPMKSVGISRDQLVIKFMLEILGDLRGLPGLFMASVLSATLSTISSGINSMTAIIWTEFGLERLQKGWIAKLVSFILGLITIGIAFSAEPLGGVLPALLGGIGCLSGPALGLVLLGVLVPWSNSVGAIFGIVIAIIANLLLFIGRVLKNPDGAYVLPTITQCCNQTYCNATSYHLEVPTVNRQGFDLFTSLSTLMLPLVGTLIALLVGSILSFLVKKLKLVGDYQYPPQLCYWSIDESETATKL